MSIEGMLMEFREGVIDLRDGRICEIVVASST